jgi:HEAT repeat protein
MKSKDTIPFLFHALTDTSSNIRSRAAEGLWNIHDNDEIPFLIKLFNSEEPKRFFTEDLRQSLTEAVAPYLTRS